MKRTLVAFFFASSALLAHAVTPTPQSIEELLALTQAEKIIETIKPQTQAVELVSDLQALQK